MDYKVIGNDMLESLKIIKIGQSAAKSLNSFSEYEKRSTTRFNTVGLSNLKWETPSVEKDEDIVCSLSKDKVVVHFFSSNLLIEDRRFYVYVYLDPRKHGIYQYGEYQFDYEPFYIGKGHGRRMYQHLSDIDKKTAFHCKLKKLVNLKLTPLILKLEENLLEKDAFLKEKLIISLIGRRICDEGPLLNLSEGGAGVTLNGEFHHFFGKNHSDATKQKIKNSCKNILNTPFYREKRKMIAKTLWENPNYRLTNLNSKKATERFGMIWDDPNHRQKMKEVVANNWSNPEIRNKMSKCISERNKKRWQDPIYRSKMTLLAKEHARLRREKKLQLKSNEL